MVTEEPCKVLNVNKSVSCFALEWSCQLKVILLVVIVVTPIFTLQVFTQHVIIRLSMKVNTDGWKRKCRLGALTR